MDRISKKIAKNQAAEQRNIIVFLNSGDPDLDMTEALIKQCDSIGIDFIELGIPFANSFSDGETIKASHQRALGNNVDLAQVLCLIERVRLTSEIPIILLADFSFSIKAEGLANFVAQAASSGVDGLLLHGLPPLYQADFLSACADNKVAPIFSLYPNSSAETIAKIAKISKGFIYLVSQYGKSGEPIDFTSKTLKQYYSAVHAKSNTPLFLGFGVKTPADVKNVFQSSSMDGVIIGSAISKIIEDCLFEGKAILPSTTKYLESITRMKSIKNQPTIKVEETL